MTKYDISTFTWYDPEPKGREMVVSVSDSSGLTFNAELRKKLPERFRVCVSPDKRVLCIVESAEAPLHLRRTAAGSSQSWRGI